MASVLTQLDIVVRIAIFIAIIVGSYVLAKFFRSLVRRLPLPASFSSQIQRVGYWIIIFFGTLFGLSQLGVDITILLVVIGLIIVIALIAFRDTLSNLGAGYLVSISKPFKVGDWVQIGSHYGHVVDMNPTHVVLASPNNEVIIVPNLSVIKEVIVNHTASGELRFSVPITVDRSYDLAKVEEALLKIANNVKTDLISNSKPEVRIIRVGKDHVEIELLLRTPNPAKRDVITSTIMRDVKNLLDKLEEKS